MAFVVTERVKGTGRLSHIWSYEWASGVARQFTFSVKSELSPRWAPAPSAEEAPLRRMAFPVWLAFLLDREEGQQQIFFGSLRGGEGRAVTTSQRSGDPSTSAPP